MPPALAHPRWSFGEPTAARVNAFLSAHRESGDSLAFSYAEVGASRDDSSFPAGYNVDHNRERLGEGEAVFASACAALSTWKMFPRPWTQIVPAERAVKRGDIVAMIAHAMGAWWLNACRIVYVLDETDVGPGCVRRFGFAYGTLPAHVEQGEERFSVELRADGSVWYDLRAFSRPRFWPVRIGKPFARRLQRRFVRESKATMRTAVQRSETVAFNR